MHPDFGKTASDYSRHRQGFPDELFEMAAAMGVVFEGARAVDLGTGTGTLARGMARRGASVTGIDPAAQLTAEAGRLDMEWGVAIHYLNTTAEHTGLESDSYDIVASGQSWWWFDAPAVLAEAHRVLRPGGLLMVCSYDWVPAPGNVVKLTESLIEKHNPEWKMGGRNGLHPEFVADLESGGFEGVRSGHRQVGALYTKEAWCGRVRASAGIGASLTPEQVAAFDCEHALALDEFSSADPINVPHTVFIAVGWKPAGLRSRSTLN